MDHATSEAFKACELMLEFLRMSTDDRHERNIVWLRAVGAAHNAVCESKNDA